MHHCNAYPPAHLHQMYNPYQSVFNQQPLRPLSLHQQLAMLEVFDAQKITDHNYDLITMVNLSQKKNLSELDNIQLKQATDWREIEGSVIHERACLNNTRCKEETSAALFRLGMYDAKVPKFQHYDYTLFLGGSIQEMQWRILMLLSLFEASLEDGRLSLGRIVALTCNRLVLKEEADESLPVTMFNVRHDPDNGRAKALVNWESEKFITETTGYQAILFSLSRFSESPEFFAHFQQTSLGYHPRLPVSFLAENSFESSVYEKQGYTFQLSNNLPELLKAFFRQYPATDSFETLMQKKGETLRKRPTTKQTVKEWLKSQNNQLLCKKKNHCKILVISNAPNTFYQHTAVVQALEESVPRPTNLTYEVSSAGPGASLDIPTNALLDNLTKLIYLEAYHPEY